MEERVSSRSLSMSSKEDPPLRFAADEDGGWFKLVLDLELERR
jgi:hypothetical protein